MYEKKPPKRKKTLAEILYDHPTSFPQKKQKSEVKVAQAQEKKNSVDQFIDETIDMSDAKGQRFEKEVKQKAIKNLLKGNLYGAIDDLSTFLGSSASRNIIQEQREKQEEEERKKREEQYRQR